MACISPPQLADTDLLAYLDGEASAQVAAHLERCPHCRKRARRLARLQRQLVAGLYRYHCPSPAELGEYHLNLLPRYQTAALDRHLVECLHCAQEVRQLEEYLAELAPELELSVLERVRGRVRVLVARLVNGGMGVDLLGQPGLAPAYSAVRGDEGETLIYDADGVQVVVEIHQEPDQPDRRNILGLVVGLDDPHLCEVHLWRDDRRVATVPVEELGNFVIPDLTPGGYELIISGPEEEIHIQGLQVGIS